MPKSKELPANWKLLVTGARSAYDDGMFDDALQRCQKLRPILIDCGRSTADIDLLIERIESDIAKPKKKGKAKKKKCACGAVLTQEEEEFGFCFACLEAEPE